MLSGRVGGCHTGSPLCTSQLRTYVTSIDPAHLLRRAVRHGSQHLHAPLLAAPRPAIHASQQRGQHQRHPCTTQVLLMGGPSRNIASCKWRTSSRNRTFHCVIGRQLITIPMAVALCTRRNSNNRFPITICNLAASAWTVTCSIVGLPVTVGADAARVAQDEQVQL